MWFWVSDQSQHRGVVQGRCRAAGSGPWASVCVAAWASGWGGRRPRSGAAYFSEWPCAFTFSFSVSQGEILCSGTFEDVVTTLSVPPGELCACNSLGSVGGLRRPRCPSVMHSRGVWLISFRLHRLLCCGAKCQTPEVPSRPAGFLWYLPRQACWGPQDGRGGRPCPRPSRSSGLALSFMTAGQVWSQSASAGSRVSRPQLCPPGASAGSARAQHSAPAVPACLQSSLACVHTWWCSRWSLDWSPLPPRVLSCE